MSSRQPSFLAESGEIETVSGPALAEVEMPQRGGWHPHDGDATSRGAGRALSGPCSERGKEVPGEVQEGQRPACAARSAADCL